MGFYEIIGFIGMGIYTKAYTVLIKHPVLKGKASMAVGHNWCYPGEQGKTMQKDGF